MAKRSIPNSTPANGRTSTPSLGRSKKRKSDDLSGRNAAEGEAGLSKQESWKENKKLGGFQDHDLISARTPFGDPGFTPSCVPAFLRDSLLSRRVKGAWWPSRSSKSPSVLTDRGRFDSYPLRRFQCRRGLCAAIVAAQGRPQRSKGGDPECRVSRSAS